MIITIDGPAASGKSTLAREIARRLNFFYIASGGLYRSLSYILLNQFGYTLDTISNPKIQDVKAALNPDRFDYSFDPQSGEKIYFDDTDITPFLKTNSIDKAASLMAESNTVHQALIEYQRALSEGRDTVIDGRNCGTVIFPNADIKIYLTASLDARAERVKELQKNSGKEVDVNQIKEMLLQRDTRDTQREFSPLLIPKDAIIVDNSYLNKEQTLQRILDVINKK